jgi:hypothetical protein
MLKLINEVHPNYQLAKQFFKDFKDESLIWTADRWAAKENMSKIGIFNILNERHSFEAIATYLESEFEKSNAEEIKIFLEKCYKYKLEYIPNEDLKFLEKDSRLCWAIINNLKYKYKEDIPRRYNFRNPYFSLIFLIHIELFNFNIQVDELRHYLKQISNKDNPVVFLSKYIENPEFIDWALKYTERKNRIITFPNFTPTNSNDQLEKLLGYWDFLYINDLQKYCIEINKLKKSWQQNIFREKNKENPKKYFHLPLKKKTKNHLEKLAHLKNMSESNVLEELINKAYEEYREYK